MHGTLHLPISNACEPEWSHLIKVRVEVYVEVCGGVCGVRGKGEPPHQGRAC